MKQVASHVPRSKLVPALAQSLLERRRLHELLRPLPHRRVALVIAGAGSGKTTFVAHALRSLAMDHVWYGLDDNDQDSRYFLQGLLCALRKRQPNFGGALPRLLHQFDPFLRAGPSQREALFQQGGLLDALIQALETDIQEHMALVLDDFHLLHEGREDCPVPEALEYLLARLPRTVHLVIISRMLPPLRLSRLRAAREVLDIGPGELAFTRDEALDLCRMLAPGNAGPQLVEGLLARTEGWAAALVLVCNDSMRSPATAERMASSGAPFSESSLRQYIEENVFLPQPEEVRVFMLRTAMAPCLEPGLCDALCGPGSRAVLERLGVSCLLLLTHQGDERHVRYHHLLRSFLLDKASVLLGEKECAVLRQRAGDYFAARNDMQNALEQYLAAGSYDSLCKVLSGLVLSDLAHCSFSLVVKAVELLPPVFLERYPAAMLLRARLDSWRGDKPKALGGLQRSLRLLEACGEQRGKVHCLKDMAFFRYLTGDVRGAYETLGSLWPEQGLDTWFYGEVGGLLVFFAALLGRFQEASAWRDTSLLRISHREGTPALLARQWILFCDSVRQQMAGDFSGAAVRLERARESFGEAGADFLLPIVCMQTSLNELLLGRPSTGLEFAAQGLRLARRLGISDHQLAWLLYVKAGNSLLAGDEATAVRCMHEAQEIFIALGNPWGQSSVRELFARVVLRQGRRAEAVEELHAAIELLRGTGLVVHQNQLRLSLAETLLGHGREGSRPRAAHIEEAAAVLEAVDLSGDASSFNRFRYGALRGVVAAHGGLWLEAGEWVAAALDVAEERGYAAWFAPFGDMLPGTSPEGEPWTRLRAMAARLPRGGSVAVESANAPQRLLVTCLGDFRVCVGERELPQDAWRNAKARRIFQYLALSHEQDFIPKDTLLELVWPEEDPACTAGRLHVALHAVRRLLEPQLQRGQHSAYLVRRGDAYRLELGPGGAVDAALFLQAVEQARRSEHVSPEQALRRYLAAEALCSGELLPAQIHEEWTHDTRLRVRFAHSSSLSRIMRLLQERQEWEACVAYAEKHLALEEHSEPTYRALMRCRAAMGDTAGAVAAYRRCEEAIVHGLGYPLSLETQTLRTQLQRDGLGAVRQAG